MGKYVVAAVAAVVIGLGVAGTAKAGYYPPVATRTVVQTNVVVAQSKKVVIRDNGYGHRSVSVRKSTFAAASVRFKQTNYYRGHGYYGY